MKLSGVIHSLIRERQPFVLLAIMALLLPAILSVAGLHAAVGSVRLADGTTIICTDSGFARIAYPDADVTHDQNSCCTTGCAHGSGTGLPGLTPVKIAKSRAVGVPEIATEIDLTTGASPASPGAIRAPPARLI